MSDLSGRMGIIGSETEVQGETASVRRPAIANREQQMHYPRKLSVIKRIKKQGFRARMRTRLGRKMINRKRRRGNHTVGIS